MRIVITGANGFLGSALIRKLRETDNDIVGVTRQSGTAHVQVASYADAPSGDVLVHLAEDSDRARVNAYGLAIETEMQSTIRQLLQKGYAKTVYASSAILYGDNHLTPRKVGDPIAVVDSYSRIKSDSESAVLGAQGVIARISNLYGPLMAKANVLNRILGQVPGSGDLVVYDSSPVRDFIWVDDAATVISNLIIGPARGVFNVGTGIGTSIYEVARSALAWSNQEERAIRSSHPSNRRSYLVLDMAETTRHAGWMPTTTLHQGVGRIIEALNNRCA